MIDIVQLVRQELAFRKSSVRIGVDELLVRSESNGRLLRFVWAEKSTLKTVVRLSIHKHRGAVVRLLDREDVGVAIFQHEFAVLRRAQDHSGVGVGHLGQD